jgi:hypothetical protein
MKIDKKTHNNNSKEEELFRRDLITQESIGRRKRRADYCLVPRNKQERQTDIPFVIPF